MCFAHPNNEHASLKGKDDILNLLLAHNALLTIVSMLDNRWRAGIQHGGHWAFRGAGNEHGPDGWVPLETVDGEPLNILLQSKSSKQPGLENFDAEVVAEEYEKALSRASLWGLHQDHVFMMVSDLAMADDQYPLAVADPHVEVVPYARHRDFYGAAGSALRFCQALSKLYREWPKG
jgi:hypothetical protein